MGLGWLISKKLAHWIAKKRELEYKPFRYCNFQFGRLHDVQHVRRSETQDDGSWSSYYECMNFYCNYKRTLTSYDNSLADPNKYPHLAFAQYPEDEDDEEDYDNYDEDDFIDDDEDDDYEPDYDYDF